MSTFAAVKQVTIYFMMALLGLTGCTGGWRYTAMRHGLDSIYALNPTGQTLAVKDIQPYVEYFDRHGTGNDRLKAYYLLGLAHSDAGEAPQALQAYYDAIERADTASSDCDYDVLIKVYGQMSQVFHQQNLPQDEIWALNRYVEYIRRTDTPAEYAIAKSQLVRPYYLLGEKDTVLQIIDSAYKTLRRLGHMQEAADILIPTIYIYTERQQFSKAMQVINIFERESKLFGKTGDIANGREGYYYIKGFYELAIGQSDSAFAKPSAMAICLKTIKDCLPYTERGTT